MLEDAIEAGGEQTIYWNQGTALPYDIMKLLEEHPNITLVFSYSYQGNDYKVSISGKNFKADPKIEWYGPVCLYSLFDGASISTSASANPTSLGNRTYTVISGDTLSKIAADLHVSVGELTRINNITNPNYIRIGQIIRY
ncbi:MAG: LysM peptidoglycan-binding domain-containing protein [Lachnospiraceae bacterium]|nr:LysM peptidoglycan-binding domain-containing protein [Lachnospiraceae bacterium]